MDVLNTIKEIIKTSKKQWYDIATQIGVSTADIFQIKSKENPLEEFVNSLTLYMWDEIFQYTDTPADRSIIKNHSNLRKIFYGWQQKMEELAEEDIDIGDVVATEIEDWKSFASVLNFDMKFIKELQETIRTCRERNEKLMHEFAQTDHLNCNEMWRFWRFYLDQFEDGKRALNEIEHSHGNLIPCGIVHLSASGKHKLKSNEKHFLIRGSNIYGKSFIMLKKYEEMMRNINAENDVVYVIKFGNESEFHGHVNCIKSVKQKNNVIVCSSEDFVRDEPDVVKPSLSLIMKHIQKIWKRKKTHIFIDGFNGSSLEKKEVVKICNHLKSLINCYIIISTHASIKENAEISNLNAQYSLLEDRSSFLICNVDYKINCSTSINKFVETTSDKIWSLDTKVREINGPHDENQNTETSFEKKSVLFDEVRSIKSANEKENGATDMLNKNPVNFYYFDKHFSDEPENISMIYFATIQYILNRERRKEKYVICTYDRDLYNDIYQFLWNYSTYSWTDNVEEFVEPTCKFNLLLTDDLSSQGYEFSNVMLLLRFHKNLLKYRMMECLNKATRELHIISDNVGVVGDPVQQPSIGQSQINVGLSNLWWSFSKSFWGLLRLESNTKSNMQSKKITAGDSTSNSMENILIYTWITLDYVNTVCCMYNISQDSFQLKQDCTTDNIIYSRKNLSNMQIKKIEKYPWKEEPEEYEEENKEEEENNLPADEMNEIDLGKAFRYITKNNNVSLLQHFVAINKIDISSYRYRSFTLLHFASGYGASDIINNFINNELFEVDCKNENELTPLHVAAECNKVTAIESLLKYHADINVKGQYGDTPIHLAARNDHVLAINSLLKNNADINIKDNDGWTPLHVAAQYGKTSAIEVLLWNYADINVKDKDGDTPLHIAARSDKVLAMEKLLSNHADVNVKNNKGKTALHFAASIDSASAIEKLLSFHADINVRNNKGETPVYIAAANDKTLAIEILLKNRADINVADNFGRTPLNISVSNKAIDIIKKFMR